MTTTTTDPIQVLEENLKALHETQNHVAKTLETRKNAMKVAQESLDLATRRYEVRVREAEDLDLAMIKHREAIARLKSVEKRAAIVENCSFPIEDDDDENYEPNGSL